jgi:hypothetical protein
MKNIVKMLSIVCIIAILVFSITPLLCSEHHCSGDGCIICSIIESFKLFLSLSIFTFAVRFILNVSDTASLGELCHHSTPVELSVKLSN